MAKEKSKLDPARAAMTEGYSGSFHGKLTTMVESMIEDVSKFYESSNRAAAARLRRTLLEIGRATKNWRKGIQNKVLDKNK